MCVIFSWLFFLLFCFSFDKRERRKKIIKGETLRNLNIMSGRLWKSTIQNLYSIFRFYSVAFSSRLFKGTRVLYSLLDFHFFFCHIDSFLFKQKRRASNHASVFLGIGRPCWLYYFSLNYSRKNISRKGTFDRFWWSRNQLLDQHLHFTLAFKKKSLEIQRK